MFYPLLVFLPIYLLFANSKRPLGPIWATLITIGPFVGWIGVVLLENFSSVKLSVISKGEVLVWLLLIIIFVLVDKIVEVWCWKKRLLFLLSIQTLLFSFLRIQSHFFIIAGVELAFFLMVQIFLMDGFRCHRLFQRTAFASVFGMFLAIFLHYYFLKHQDSNYVSATMVGLLGISILYKIDQFCSLDDKRLYNCFPVVFGHLYFCVFRIIAEYSSNNITTIFLAATIFYAVARISQGFLKIERYYEIAFYTVIMITIATKMSNKVFQFSLLLLGFLLFLPRSNLVRQREGFFNIIYSFCATGLILGYFIIETDLPRLALANPINLSLLAGIQAIFLLLFYYSMLNARR